jgi:uncharacterized Zn finger protein (UPF0148 family)
MGSGGRYINYLHCEKCGRNFSQETGLYFCPYCEVFLKTRTALEPHRGIYDYHYLKYGLQNDLEESYQTDEEDWKIEDKEK